MEYKDILDFVSREKSLSAWEITHVEKVEHQLYVTMGEIESQRRIDAEKVHLNLYMDQNLNGKPMMGESSLILSPGEDYKKMIGSSMEMARLVSNEPFTLPGPGVEYVQVETYDQETASFPLRTLEVIHGKIKEACEDDITLSSAELFVSEVHIRFFNSLGLELQDKNTRIFTDFVLLTGKDEHSEVESHGFKEARFLRDLNVGEMIKEYAQFARESLTARTPPTGTFDVVFSHEALDTFFKYFKSQAGGPAKHQGWSHYEEGKPVDGKWRGDRLTLASDPTLPGGIQSASFDGNGLPLVRVDVIHDGIFKQRTVDSRYASYLNLPPSGSFTNVVVGTGDKSFEELLKPEPILHLLKFSTFEPHPVSGAFSGEIRVGYLLQDGKVQPLKGGSVSGVMDKALEEMYFSKESVKRESYQGPKGIKVCALNIAGA